MKFGISTASFYPDLTEKAFEGICKFGVPYAEIFFNTMSEIEEGFVKNLKSVADYYGTKVLSFHPFTCAFEPFMLFSNYERRFNDAIEYHKKYFNAMNILGTEIFVLHGDRAGSQTEPSDYYERFAVLRDLGKSFGVTVAQENVVRCKSRDLDFLVNMRKYLKGDVSFVFDNKQAVRSNVDYRDFIDALGDSIVHVHISDNNEERDCLPLGMGNLDVSDLLSRLKEKGYEEGVIVELYRDAFTNTESIFNSYKLLTKLDV